MRIFLDANVLFSAAKSAGAIRLLLHALHAAGHRLVADEYVATEARRNARATRKEERSNKTTKKERVEFLELPPQGLSVEELADKLALNSADIIKALFLKGIMTTVNMARTPLATNAAIAHPQPRPCADFGQREGAAAGQGVRG